MICQSGCPVPAGPNSLDVHLDCEGADEYGGQHDAVASEEGAVWWVSGGVRVSDVVTEDYL